MSTLRPTSTRGRVERRGSAIVAALIAVMVVFALCMGFLTVSSSITGRLRASVDAKQAFNLAETGLAEAYAGLAVARTGNVGTPAEPAAIGDGVFWVTATELGDGVVELESTGMYGRGRITLGMAVRRVQINLSSLGLFSSQDFVIQGNSFLDSYDSSQGTYSEHVAAGTNRATVVGSNGNVSVGNGSSVLGDIVHGPAASVSNAGTVTGTIQPRPAAAPLPPVEVPDLTLDPALTAGALAPLVIPPGQAGYQSLTVQRGAQAILTGPVELVLGDLQVEGGGLLTFDNSQGPVDLYVTGDLVLATGSMATTVSDDPGMATIQVSSSDKRNITFGATATFYGQVYAPQGVAKVLPSFELFGSLVAGLVDISALGRMHYDRNTLPTRREALPAMWAWQVVDVPDPVAGRGTDPFQLLGVDRRALPSPAQAHQDQQLVLTYIDLAGVTRTYNGLESPFDWTQVRQVLNGTRDGQLFVKPPDRAATTASETPALSPEEQALVDQIKSPATSAEIYAALAAKYPVSEAVLLEAIRRVPPMSASDLYWLLLEYGPSMPKYVGGRAAGPASDAILMSAVIEPALGSREIGWLLEQNSPLSPEVLAAALIRVPALKAADLNKILNAQ